MLRNSCIQTAHEPQFAMEETRKELKKSFWWPAMNQDIENHVRNCRECNQSPFLKAVNIAGKRKTNHLIG